MVSAVPAPGVSLLFHRMGLGQLKLSVSLRASSPGCPASPPCTAVGPEAGSRQKAARCHPAVAPPTARSPGCPWNGQSVISPPGISFPWATPTQEGSGFLPLRLAMHSLRLCPSAARRPLPPAFPCPCLITQRTSIHPQSLLLSCLLTPRTTGVHLGIPRSYSKSINS